MQPQKFLFPEANSGRAVGGGGGHNITPDAQAFLLLGVIRAVGIAEL
jgi:hypothetical protein